MIRCGIIDMFDMWQTSSITTTETRKELRTMITKAEFEEGKSEQAKIEIKSVIESIEAALRNGSTSVSTYKSFKTPDNIIVAAVTKHVAEYGWSLKHSSYAGDQRDPGTTHTWSLH